MENGRNEYINNSINMFCGNCTKTMKDLIYDFLMHHPKIKHSDVIDLCILINNLVNNSGAESNS